MLKSTEQDRYTQSCVVKYTVLLSWLRLWLSVLDRSDQGGNRRARHSWMLKVSH